MTTEYQRMKKTEQNINVNSLLLNGYYDNFYSEEKELSIYAYLPNSTHRTGETYMFADKDGDLLETEKGDLYVFHSCFLFPHYVTPVTKGTRYSYVSWVW